MAMGYSRVRASCPHWCLSKRAILVIGTFFAESLEAVRPVQGIPVMVHSPLSWLVRG